MSPQAIGRVGLAFGLGFAVVSLWTGSTYAAALSTSTLWFSIGFLVRGSIEDSP